MYDKPPGTIQELLEPFPQQIRDLTDEIRQVILAVLPDSEENVYGGKKVGNVLYSVGGTGNVICGMQPQQTFVRVFFHRWERLKAQGYRIQGSGKHARHVKISAPSEIDAIGLTAMLNIVKE